MSSDAYVVPSDRELTILSQLPQVELLAKQIHRRCPPEVELADLISAGTVGLIKEVAHNLWLHRPPTLRSVDNPEVVTD